MNDDISTFEAAEMLDLSPRSIARLCRKGRLKAKRMSGVWLVDRQSVEEYRTAAKGKAKRDPRRQL